MYFIISFILLLHWHPTFLKFGGLYNFCFLSGASQDKATKQLCPAEVFACTVNIMQICPHWICPHIGLKSQRILVCTALVKSWGFGTGIARPCLDESQKYCCIQIMSDYDITGPKKCV